MIAHRQPKKQFAIRRATTDDCAGALQCLAAAFAPYRESYTPEAFLDTVLTPQSFAKRLADMSLFVATSMGGQIIGTIACKAVTEKEGHLRGMAVRPEWQGLSIAKQLLGYAERELRRSGCSVVTLDTTAPLKAAMRFYEKNGYKRTSRIENFFGMPLFEYRKIIWDRRAEGVGSGDACSQQYSD